MDDLGTWHRVGDARFVSLTTFRRSGEPVPTPVWVVRDGDDLWVTTPARSGKVRRLREDSRVELRPCSRRGAVAEDAPTVGGHAQVLVAPDAVAAAQRLLARKYRLEFRVVRLVERVVRRGNPERAALRITPA
ncbi:PPOX class F420-dependent oxidoreductase [Phycicoccus flavus]|uniref:PPOX class F420-dependent oxidoreductase n=1 Tax=Phycicoccus flavus TaxID=2502783 RepID=UPI000FEB7C9B|nr:PPOX class F420-dependent oxidoreductase [Phycicoccus flavus]NHA69069.1 PPOX class F420-dependent oxidoreductase [Phycicoccus flavus]